MNKRIGKEAKKLLLGDLIYILTGVFINTFLVAYFLQVTNDSITKISLYYITVHAIRFIGSLAIGEHIKKHPNIIKPVLSLSVIARAIFILFIVVLKENIVNSYVWVASIYAVSEVLYWSTHEMMYIGLTNNDNRKKFVSTKKVLDKIINIVAPVVLGTSIELASFNDIAIYVFVLALIEIALTLWIKQPHMANETKKYNMQGFKTAVGEYGIEDVKNFARASLVYGIFEKSVSKIIILLTLMTFETQMNLGIFTTIFAICDMLSIIIYSKLNTKRIYANILKILSLVTVFSVVGLLLDINKTTLIIYNFCYIISTVIFNLEYNIKKANIVVDNKLEEYKEEYLAYVTAAITLGRFIGYVLLLMVGIINSELVLKAILLLITVTIPMYGLFLIKIENKEYTKIK